MHSFNFEVLCIYKGSIFIVLMWVLALTLRWCHVRQHEYILIYISLDVPITALMYTPLVIATVDHLQ